MHSFALESHLTRDKLLLGILLGNTSWRLLTWLACLSNAKQQTWHKYQHNRTAAEELGRKLCCIWVFISRMLHDIQTYAGCSVLTRHIPRKSLCLSRVIPPGNRRTVIGTAAQRRSTRTKRRRSSQVIERGASRGPCPAAATTSTPCPRCRTLAPRLSQREGYPLSSFWIEHFLRGR